MVWTAALIAGVIEVAFWRLDPAGQSGPNNSAALAADDAQSSGHSWFSFGSSSKHAARDADPSIPASTSGGVNRAQHGSAGAAALVLLPNAEKHPPLQQGQELIDHALKAGMWGPEEAQQLASLRGELTTAEFDTLLARVVNSINRYQMKLDGIRSVVPMPAGP